MRSVPGVLGIFTLLLMIGGCAADSVEQLRAKALAAMASKDVKTAEIHLKNLLQRSESDAEARLLLARVHHANLDWRGVEKEARRALSLGASPKDVVPLLLEALGNTLEPAKLVAEVAALRAEDPATQAVIRYWSGQAQLRQGKRLEARRELEAALSIDSQLVQAQAGLLALDFAEGRNQADTARQIDELATRFPNSTDALKLKADAQLAGSKVDEARQTMRAILAISPNDLMAKMKLAALELKQKNFDESEKQIKEVLAKAPSWPAALTLRAEVEVGRGRPDAAREFIQSALKGGANYPPALAMAASLALTAGALEQAESYGKQLIDLLPRSTAGYRLLAATHLRKGEPDRALAVLKPAIDADSQDPEVYALAGEALLRSNDATGALRQFEKAIKIGGGDSAKQSGVAMARMLMGDVQSGLDGLREAASLSASVTPADFLLVDALLRNRDFGKAIAAVDDLERRQGTANAVSHELRGKVQLAQGDQAGARTSFQNSLAADSLYFPPASRLAALDLADKKPEAARERLKPFLARNPKNVPALLAQAEVLQRSGALSAEVTELLKRAVAVDPGDLRSVIALAGTLSRAGEGREAIPVLDTAIQAKPRQHLFHLALADVYQQLGDSQRALDSLGKAVQINPRDGAVHMKLGQANLALGKPNDALASFGKAAELNPAAIEPKLATAQVYTAQGKVQDALRVARDLQKTAPRRSAGWNLEGDILAAGEQWKEALKAYRQAFEIASDETATVVRLVRAMARSGDVGRANQLLARRLAAKPDDLLLHRFAGERDIEDKRFQSAISHFEQVLKASPNDPAALNNIAWALNELKDPKAMSFAERAYKLAPSNASIVDTLATILVDSGNTSRGLEMHLEATRLAPRSGMLRLRYAQALAKTGAKDRARKEIDLLLAGNNPENVLRAARDLQREL